MARKEGESGVESELNFGDGFLEGTPVQNRRLWAVNEGPQRSARPERRLQERKTRVNRS